MALNNAMPRYASDTAPTLARAFAPPKETADAWAAWGKAARDALDDVGQSTQVWSNVVADAMQGVFGANGVVEDTLTAFVASGGKARIAFKSIVDGIVADLARLAVRQAIVRPAINAFAGLFEGAGATGATGASTGATALAPTPFARGGVIDAPTLFPLGRGLGLAGESGPEAILPLSVGTGGRLGVAAAAPAPVTIQVVDQRGHGAPVAVSRQRAGDGRESVRILIRDAVDTAIRSGELDKAFTARGYGKSTRL